MKHNDVVTGGRNAPARHHELVRPAVGVVLAGLSLALVFTSGYLIGSTKADPSTATASQSSPQARAGLPAPSDALRPSDRSESPQPPDSDPSRLSAKRSITVHQGDNLSNIAASIAPQADTQAIVRRIVALNSLDDSDALEVGQRLVVPVTKGSTRHSRPEHEAFSRLLSPVARPVSLSIPRLELRQHLVELNVIDGTLQVPTDYADVGWWRDGPPPGAPGSSVLVGHVDSPTGPAVFYGLSALVDGDTILVRRADNSTATFRVASTELVSRADFPSEQVYRRDGRPTLSLLTCGGTYDQGLGQYDSNVLVTAYLVDAKAKKKPTKQGVDEPSTSHTHMHRAPVRDDKVVARG